jgi:hypothetical protein
VLPGLDEPSRQDCGEPLHGKLLYYFAIDELGMPHCASTAYQNDLRNRFSSSKKGNPNCGATRTRKERFLLTAEDAVIIAILNRSG